MPTPSGPPSWYRPTYHPDNLSSLAALQQRARLTAPEAAAWLGVTLRTYRRWLKAGAPQWARLLLALRGGHMPWPAWDGWRMTEAGLVPRGLREEWSPGDIMALPYLTQLVAELKRQVRHFRKLDDQAAFNAEVLPRHRGPA